MQNVKFISSERWRRRRKILINFALVKISWKIYKPESDVFDLRAHTKIEKFSILFTAGDVNQVQERFTMCYFCFAHPHTTHTLIYGPQALDPVAFGDAGSQDFWHNYLHVEIATE